MKATRRQSAADFATPTSATRPSSPGQKGDGDALTLVEITTNLEETVAGLSGQLQALSQCQDEVSRAAACRELHGLTEFLVACATSAGRKNLVRQASALQAFLQELALKPSHLTDSGLGTISLAVDVLNSLAGNPDLSESQSCEAIALVVDNEPASCAAICNALRRVDLTPHALADPNTALDYLSTHKADLILLDVATAAKSGCDFYARVSELRLHIQTPVILVTTPGGSPPSPSTLSSAETQLLVKPYSIIHYLELALKALSRVLKHRTEGPSTPANASAPAGGTIVPLPSSTESLSQLERTHAALRNTHEQLQKSYEQTRTALERESQQRKDLENTVAELKNSQAQLENRIVEQLEAKAAALEKASPGKSSTALQAKLASEQQASASLRKRVEELENLLKKNASETDRPSSAQSPDKTDASSEDLQAKLVAEQKAAAESRKHAEELRQLLAQTKSELETAQNECARSRGLFGFLRGSKMHAELQAKLGSEQQAVALLKKRVEELKELVERRNKELETARAEHPTSPGLATLTQSADERACENQAAETALKEKDERCSKLEKELTNLRRERDQLQLKLADESKAAADAKAAEAKATAEAKAAAEARAVAEAKAVTETKAADEAKAAAEAARTAAQDRPAELTPAPSADLADLEHQVRESVTLRARATAELEQERGERRRVEHRASSLATQLQTLHDQLRQQLESDAASQNRIAELERQLRDRDEAISRSSAECQKEKAERQLAEEQLLNTSHLSEQLRNCLAAFEVAKQAFKRTQDQMESRLQNSQKSASDAQARLDKEVSERQRLEQTAGEAAARLQKEVSEREKLQEALAAAQRSLVEQTQKTEMELSRLQSDLELEQAERKRLEGDALQSRYASLDSARVGLSMVNKLRTRIRPPLDTVVQSTRRLLELQLEPEHKKITEALLENALLVQTTLEESSSSSSSLGITAAAA